MVDMMTGMPFYWVGPAAPGHGGSAQAQIDANLAQNQAASWNLRDWMASQQGMMNNANAAAAAATANLTQDPAKYAYIGAAYGRAAGNSPGGWHGEPGASGGGMPAVPSGSVSRGPDLPDLSTSPDFGQPDPMAGWGGAPIPSAPQMPTAYGGPGQYNSPFQQYGHGGFNPFESYNPATPGGPGQSAGRGTAAAPQFDPFDPALNAGMSFEDRWGVSTPSQSWQQIARDNIANALVQQGGGGSAWTMPHNDAQVQQGGGGSAWATQPGASFADRWGGYDSPTPGQAAIDAVNQFRGVGTGHNVPQMPPDPFDPALNAGGHVPDFNTRWSDVPQSLEEQLQGILGGIDRATSQPSPQYLPPGQDTLSPADRGIPWGGGSFTSVNGGPQVPTVAQGGDVDMSDYQSPSNRYDQFQKGATYPWLNSIPSQHYDPTTINSVYRTAGNLGVDPAALAGVIGVESGWDPANATGSYRGMTQMGPQSFKEAGGQLGGQTWDQYRTGSGASQIDAYAPWLQHYAQGNPDNAASLVTGGIGGLDPPMQAAIMQGTQFGPNASGWVRALGEGNMSMPTTPSAQAKELGDTSIGQMYNAYANRMGRW